MKKDLQIQNLAKELSDEIKANGNDGAILALTYADKRLAVSMAGTEPELITAIAKAINANKELGAVLEAAIAVAPIVGLLYGEGEDAAECTCPRCTAERAAKMSNPNVN